MTRVLLTGFEPFLDWTVNSSWEAVHLVAARTGGLRSERLPVDHRFAAERIVALIGETRPEVVLLTGLAAGSALRLETLARPGPLAPQGGPMLRRARWPLAQARWALTARAVPARLSRDAGGYVCETTYWAALGAPGPRLCLFLHVPPLGPSWTVGRIARGVQAVLKSGLSVRAAG